MLRVMDGGVIMLREVSCGQGRAEGEETVGYSVEDTLILGRDGVMG